MAEIDQAEPVPSYILVNANTRCLLSLPHEWHPWDWDNLICVKCY
jgi:hypothetical protein